jgi:hypothetical protein
MFTQLQLSQTPPPPKGAKQETFINFEALKEVYDFDRKNIIAGMKVVANMWLHLLCH